MNIWRITTLCSGVVALLLLTSCATAPLKAIRTPPPEGTDGEGWNKMHLRAAADLSCPIESLSTKTLSDQSLEDGRRQSFEISGCGTSEMFFMQKVKYGMWSFVSDQDLRQKTKFSLGDKCPGWTVEFIDHATRGVRACDEKLIYVLTSSGWVVNTVAGSDGMTK
jgi:hypothetical protein